MPFLLLLHFYKVFYKVFYFTLCGLTVRPAPPVFLCLLTERKGALLLHPLAAAANYTRQSHRLLVNQFHGHTPTDLHWEQHM